MEDKYEHIKFAIERFDHYYDTINSKGSFYVGLNSFIFGGVCVGYTSLVDKLNTNFWIWFLLILLIASSWISIYFTLSAIQPYQKDSHANDQNPSLLFFGGIARHELSFFIEKFNAQTTEEISTDAAKQLHSLAKGLDKKFKRLRFAGILLMIQFSVMVPLFFLIIQNLK
jgi:hypothetical protein